MVRVTKYDAAETMDLITKQMNKVLTDKGLVVFGENEFTQGVDACVIKKQWKITV